MTDLVVVTGIKRVQAWGCAFIRVKSQAYGFLGSLFMNLKQKNGNYPVLLCDLK